MSQVKHMWAPPPLKRLPWALACVRIMRISFLSLCRQVGLPARYVSGYLPGEGQMHAWVEVLLPLGPKETPTWMAFDPTHQCRCDERYITVAVGRDYQDVAPTSGHYSGESSNELKTTVAVVIESQGVGDYWQSPQLMLQETSSNWARSGAVMSFLHLFFEI